MVKSEVTCSVPGCDNMLTKEQVQKKIAVCSSCEAAKMHLCESCGKQLAQKRIRNGATLCRECELNPSDLSETEALEYESEYGSEEFMV
ncbi:hypothetical protein AKJ63_00995 [candidate division MSBL1 archaeon SCGC-AAA259D18]|uniref:Uncharacterized protein n=2 Tax=candidate division MSBL1 TaxID=215777 RepID=A0A133UBI2_9EURY|nr:hypothetical protein AKJ57_00850 [candidate division MSBL1 archaeon SCGC-AAA259A05]KXA91774.1 hypothetical protein AKJ63_00995 [candidate division MSBL1 archaeon SCGC-AAA259D18]